MVLVTLRSNGVTVFMMCFYVFVYGVLPCIHLHGERRECARSRVLFRSTEVKFSEPPVAMVCVCCPADLLGVQMHVVS